jgi:hypothetical protein
MARDIYDIGAIFCCYFPLLFTLVSLLTYFPIPDAFFIVVIILSVCVFNGVWGAVKPKIVKKKDKNPEFGYNSPPVFSFNSNTQTTSGFNAPRICPGCGSVVPEGSVFCPNCGSTV